MNIYFLYVYVCMYVCTLCVYRNVHAYMQTDRQTDTETETETETETDRQTETDRHRQLCLYLSFLRASNRYRPSLEAGFTAMDLRVYAFGVHNAEATKIEGRYNDSSRIYLVSCAIVCSSIPGNF